MERLDNEQIHSAGLADWRKMAQALHVRYKVADVAAAAAFITALAKVAGDAYHLELKLSDDVVDISLCTREDGRWVTQRDIDMARKISDIATTSGAEPRPSEVTQLEIALDTADEDRVKGVMRTTSRV